MIRRLSILFVLALAGCTPESGVVLHPREYTGEVCPNCPVVYLSIPEADDATRLGKAVNAALREEVIELLDYDQDRDARDIPGAIAAFQAGFRDLQEEFPEELTGWEARVEAQKSYEDPGVLGLKMETYIFTGGAHGYAATRYLNFDRGTGEELDGPGLFRDPEAFRAFAEAAFRRKYDIPEGEPINSTGFMFEENRFSLPQNIGLTAEGLVLHYNPYEAASYADGNLVVAFPYEEIRAFLSWAP